MAAVHGQVEEAVAALSPDKRRSPKAGHGANTTQSTGVVNYTDRNSMEVYLLAHGYTQINLNSMNFNDLTYATRRAQDPTGI